jgi:hypothetical protein
MDLTKEGEVGEWRQEAGGGGEKKTLQYAVSSRSASVLTFVDAILFKLGHMQ